MKKIVYAIIISALVLTGCNDEPGELKTIEGNGTKIDAVRFIEEYEDLDIAVNNPIKYLEENEIIDFFKKETGIILICMPNSSDCRSAIPVLLEIAREESLDTVYYINVNNISNNIRSSLMELLDNYLMENAEGNKTIFVPDVYAIRNGNILDNHIGGVSGNNIAGLKQIYSDLITLMRGE